MKKTISILALILVLVLLISCNDFRSGKQKPLPKSEPDSESPFGIDKNINMTTIDGYLNREDSIYIDMRMLFDPADFSSIGGDADLSRTIKGFRIVPYPYIATLNALPVAGAYDGNCLFSVIWDGSEVVSAEANYIESNIILEELFPKDKAIFLMCGGGGYSGMMKSLLIYLGWNEESVYNIGGNWSYLGNNSEELIIYPEDASDRKIYATWRADYTYIDFSRLQRING